MGRLNRRKLHVTFARGAEPQGPLTPRAYTLTHSDSSGDMFLTVGPDHDRRQVGGWYTRLMRDEVLAEWLMEEHPRLMVHCHVSGGLVVGTARWRYGIFRHHMPLVLEAFRWGDRELFKAHPDLGRAAIVVNFHSADPRYEHSEQWGTFAEIE